MGWARIATLESDPDFPPGEDSLWTRGGFEGVKVRVGEQTVTIPREILELLAGEEIRNACVRRAENKDALTVFRDLLT